MIPWQALQDSWETYVAFHASSMHHLVDVVGRNAGFDFTRGNVQNFATQAASLTHAFLLGLGQDLDLISADKDLKHRSSARLHSLPYCSAIPSLAQLCLHSCNSPNYHFFATLFPSFFRTDIAYLLALRDAIAGIVGLPYSIWHRAPGAQRVDRPEASREGIGGERVEMAICVRL